MYRATSKIFRGGGHNGMTSAGAFRYKTRFAYPTGMKAYEDDYAEVAEYPPVDFETRHYSNRVKANRQKFFDWQKSIGSKDTIEEKLMEMNANRNYGWMAYNLTEDFFDYDAPGFIKYITRTESKPHSSNMSSIYSSPELLKKTKYYSEKIKGSLEEVLKFEMYGEQRPRPDDETAAQFALARNQGIANQLSRFVLQSLSADEPLLNQVQVDYRPKSEAFWFVGGFIPKTSKLEWIERLKGKGATDNNWLAEISHLEHSFQYLGTPLVQVRSQTPLPNFIEKNFDSNTSNAVLYEYPQNPKMYGFHKNLRYATNIPGHWSGDPAKANFLSFHSAHFIESTSVDGTPPEFDTLKQSQYINRRPKLMETQGILASFSRLLAQAYMLGFDQFGDIVYPLTTQTVVFNGIDWSFSYYQLNTIQLDQFKIKKNLKRNYCWTLPPMKLFEENGSLSPGFLEAVLAFFLAPTFSEQENLVPNVKFNLNDLTDDYRREFVLYNFHEMVSQRRQDHMNLQLPEIYDWQKIYQIKHKTRPMDARKKFFLIPGDNPYTYKYLYKNPRYRTKRLHFLEAELAKKKQEKAVQDIKDAQLNIFKNDEPQ